MEITDGNRRHIIEAMKEIHDTAAKLVTEEDKRVRTNLANAIADQLENMANSLRIQHHEWTPGETIPPRQS